VTPALIAVLIKDPADAKQRLSPVLMPGERRSLAEENARRALRAAASVAETVAICGSAAAADLARAAGVEAIVETEPTGQNGAAQRAIEVAESRGAPAVLILSSDLPLIHAAGLRRLLATAATLPEPSMVAAAARGREGTNALLLAPPGGVGLHFGMSSLPKFEAEARRRGRAFTVHEEPVLALDLDEASDLEELRRLRATA
jgi:2-phospho-L-lactate guanylyltransferase